MFEADCICVNSASKRLLAGFLTTDLEGRGFRGCGKTRERCHSEEQRRRRISHCLEDAQSEILRCAQDDSIVGLFRSLFSPALPAAPSRVVRIAG